jgi:hypothetical protein
MTAQEFINISTGTFNSFIPEDCDFGISLTDSMPVVTSNGKNIKAKVAGEVVDKGYCYTRNMYCYVLKLHLSDFRKSGNLPFPEFIRLTAASENDMTALKELFGIICDRMIFGGRIFSDHPYFDVKQVEQNIGMFSRITEYLN